MLHRSSPWPGGALLSTSMGLADDQLSLNEPRDPVIPMRSVGTADLQDLSGMGLSAQQPGADNRSVRLSVILWDELSRRKPARPVTPPVNSAAAGSVTVSTTP